MKPLFSLLCILLPVVLPQRKPVIWMIGDSTMSVKSEKAAPETGWGMAFATLFQEGVKVENRAMNGRSTLSFQTENRWQPVADNLQEGDYVFIQFGHNDEKTDKPGTGVSHEAFKANLEKFVTETRARKAIPVLLTSIVRRSFKNGVLENTHKGYPDVTRQVAQQMQVPLIDMEQSTSALVSQMGEEASAQLYLHLPAGHPNYPNGKTDNTHLSPAGAKAYAALAVDGMKKLQLDLVKYLQ